MTSPIRDDLLEQLGRSVAAGAALAHETARSKGFWPEDGSSRPTPEVLMLIASEAFEALEADRYGSPILWQRHSVSCRLPDYSVGKCECPYQGVMAEVADVIIRALDFLGHLQQLSGEEHGLDAGDVLISKMRFNADRPYLHGRKY